MAELCQQSCAFLRCFNTAQVKGKPQEPLFLAVVAEAPGEFRQYLFPTEAEAKKQTKTYWHSWVLYRCSAPKGILRRTGWVEIGCGGVGGWVLRLPTRSKLEAIRHHVLANIEPPPWSIKEAETSAQMTGCTPPTDVHPDEDDLPPIPTSSVDAPAVPRGPSVRRSLSKGAQGLRAAPSAVAESAAQKVRSAPGAVASMASAPVGAIASLASAQVGAMSSIGGGLTTGATTLASNGVADALRASGNAKPERKQTESEDGTQGSAEAEISAAPKTDEPPVARSSWGRDKEKTIIQLFAEESKLEGAERQMEFQMALGQRELSSIRNRAYARAARS